MCPDGTELLTNKQDVLNRWGEHFNNLLNIDRAADLAHISSMSALPTSNELDSPLTLLEVVVAVQQEQSRKKFLRIPQDNIMSILRRSVCLSQYVVSPRIKSIGSHVGCPSSSHQYLPSAYPALSSKTEQVEKVEKEPESRVRFPEVWRDRFSAAIQLTSTPEARSLTCL